jgi:hypothetical protein
MKQEMFKEINAHIRACDSKSLALNAGYIAVLIFLNSNKAEDNFFKGGLNYLELDSKYYEAILILVVMVIGYVILFMQLWFRGWKRHYLEICHKIWESQKTEFGDQVPVWMKKSTPVMSYDNIFRLVPFFINAFLLIRLPEFLLPILPEFLTQIFSTLIWIIGLLALHFALSLYFVQISSNVGDYAA